MALKANAQFQKYELIENKYGKLTFLATFGEHESSWKEQFDHELSIRRMTFSTTKRDPNGNNREEVVRPRRARDTTQLVPALDSLQQITLMGYNLERAKRTLRPNK